MSALSTLPIPTARSRHRFSVDEYDQMIKFGILTENDRVELIRGEIVEKTTINPPRAAAVKRINQLLINSFGKRINVGVQDPIRLPDSVPEPDLSVMKFRADYYVQQHPQPDDILLVIEVAASSIDDDRNVQGPLYAESGIIEYWIVNLNDTTLEVYRSPQTDGTYADRQILQRGEQIEIQALPGTVLNVADII